jgi:hypothetical protein
MSNEFRCRSLSLTLFRPYRLSLPLTTDDNSVDSGFNKRATKGSGRSIQCSFIELENVHAYTPHWFYRLVRQMQHGCDATGSNRHLDNQLGCFDSLIFETNMTAIWQHYGLGKVS